MLELSRFGAFARDVRHDPVERRERTPLVDERPQIVQRAAVAAERASAAENAGHFRSVYRLCDPRTLRLGLRIAF